MTVTPESNRNPENISAHLDAVSNIYFKDTVELYKEAFKYYSYIDSVTIKNFRTPTILLNRALGLKELKKAVAVTTVAYSFDPDTHRAVDGPIPLIDQWAHFKGVNIADVEGSVQPVLHFLTPNTDTRLEPHHFVTLPTPDIFLQFESMSASEYQGSPKNSPMQRLYGLSVAARFEMELESDLFDQHTKGERLAQLRRRIDFELQRWFDIESNCRVTCTAPEYISYRPNADKALPNFSFVDNNGLTVSGIKRITQIAGAPDSDPKLNQLLMNTGHPVGMAYLHLVDEVGTKLWIPIEKIMDVNAADSFDV